MVAMDEPLKRHHKRATITTFSHIPCQKNRLPDCSLYQQEGMDIGSCIAELTPLGRACFS